jgi:asparagine synthase (glutamine-hydrolysing)
MCGISGIISRKNLAISESQLRRMNDAVAHRGPDGEGFYQGANFGLGHRRLSIIDLSENAGQPMFYGKGLAIVFNGEIYNYIELREELLAKGYTFSTSSDTEVILAAYRCWGENCVRRFNGMWAIAIYDEITQTIFCSRDRFGVKPFYYTVTPDYFAFGSEIKQLIPFHQQASLNVKIALDYLIAGLEEHTDETFFEHIIKLQPGHNLVYQLTKHEYAITRFYELNFSAAINKLDEEHAVQLYREGLLRSIALRLRSDVKVGTCLSGGLDSSSVAALAGEQFSAASGMKFTAIHARSSEKETDESSLAKEVADFCKLDLHVLEPTAGDFYKNLDEVIYTQEEPFGSPSVFMQYLVLQKACELGCIVMLDGQGGDETLLGYEKYYPAYLMSLNGVKKWRGFMDSARNSKLSRKQVVQYFFYFTRYKIRLWHLKRRSRHFKSSVLRAYQSDTLKQLASTYLAIDKLQRFEIQKTQLPHLLKYEDKNSMRNSVETRLPFVDYQLVETALSVNNEFKIKGGWTKYLLRRGIEKNLPASIVWRKNKLGFNAPEKTWLDQMNEEMVAEIQNSVALSGFIDMSRLDLTKLDLRSKWRLFNFARWQKLYNVKTS